MPPTQHHDLRGLLPPGRRGWRLRARAPPIPKNHQALHWFAVTTREVLEHVPWLCPGSPSSRPRVCRRGREVMLPWDTAGVADGMFLQTGNCIVMVQTGSCCGLHSACPKSPELLRPTQLTPDAGCLRTEPPDPKPSRLRPGGSLAGCRHAQLPGDAARGQGATSGGLGALARVLVQEGREPGERRRGVQLSPVPMLGSRRSQQHGLRRCHWGLGWLLPRWPLSGGLGERP